MKAKLFELTGNGACRRRRTYQYDFGERNLDYIMKAREEKKAIYEGITGRKTPDEIKEDLKEAFEKFDFLSDRQRKIHTSDAIRQVLRYVSSEKRKPEAPLERTVILGTDASGENVTITMKPTVFSEVVPVYKEEEKGRRKKKEEEEKPICYIPQIEVVQYKCKKPSKAIDKQAHVKENLELYALLKYGRLLVMPGETVRVKASIYYLRKTNDSNSVTEPKFDPDFFNLRGGNNIIHLEEDITKDIFSIPFTDEERTEMDKHFEPLVKRFANGMEEEDCSEQECSSCPLDHVCHFKEAPASVTEKKSGKTVRSIRFTPQQFQAKEYEKGICRINAGAGAGKTLTIAYRVVSLLNKGVKPEEILVTTFTNAAGTELRERIMAYAEDDGIADEVDIRKIRIQTFNAFGDDIIKAEYARLGFDKAPLLIDEVERYRIIASMIAEENVPGLDYRNFTANNFGVKGAVAIAAKVFDILKRHREYTSADTKQILEDLGNDAAFCTEESIAKLYLLYNDYDNRLREENRIEYSDQEGLIFELLDSEPYYFEQFKLRHLIIDEFQDSSKNQLDIIKRLVECPTFESLMVVGDDDQSIYGFRETTPEYITHFDDVMGAKIDDIELVENHRSTPEIIHFANNIIRHNTSRLGKSLHATRPSGDPVRVKGFYCKADEINFVVADIKKKLEEGRKAEDIAVIARNKAELLDVADALAKESIPSVIQFPEPLCEDSRVLAACAMINAVRDKSDTKDLLIYANALVSGKLKDADKESIDKAVAAATERIDNFLRKEGETDKKEALKTMLEELDPADADNPNGKDSLYAAFRETLLARDTEEAIRYCDDFNRYGENVAAKRSGNYPGIVLSTAHSSKGLEWPVVYNMITKYDSDKYHTWSKKNHDRMEEERRLFFVSATRARDELIVTGQYVLGTVKNRVAHQFILEALRALGEEISDTQIIYDEHKWRENEKAKKKAEKAAEERTSGVA